MGWPFAEEGLHRAGLHLDDAGGEEPVRLAVHVLDGLGVGPLGQAEHRPVVLVEPVREVADAVLVLHADVGGVRGRDVLRAGAGYLVTIEEERHQVQPPSRRGPPRVCTARDSTASAEAVWSVETRC